MVYSETSVLRKWKDACSIRTTQNCYWQGQMWSFGQIKPLESKLNHASWYDHSLLVKIIKMFGTFTVCVWVSTLINSTRVFFFLSHRAELKTKKWQELSRLPQKWKRKHWAIIQFPSPKSNLPFATIIYHGCVIVSRQLRRAGRLLIL